MTPHIHTCLWFDTQAEEAAGFYTALFPNSRITSVLRYGTGDPMPEGTVQMWRVVADRAAVRPGVHAGSAQPGQAAHDHRHEADAQARHRRTRTRLRRRTLTTDPGRHR